MRTLTLALAVTAIAMGMLPAHGAEPRGEARRSSKIATRNGASAFPATLSDCQTSPIHRCRAIGLSSSISTSQPESGPPLPLVIYLHGGGGWQAGHTPALGCL